MRNLSDLNRQPTLTLGLPGFQFQDLYRPAGLQRLSQQFDAQVEKDAPALMARFEAYRTACRAGTPVGGLTPPQESELLIEMAGHLSRFVVTLFQLETESERLQRRLTGELSLMEFKREFVARKVFKKGAPDRPTAAELSSLDARMQLLFQLGFQRPGETKDAERAIAEAVITLLEVERGLSGQLTHNMKPTPETDARLAQLRHRWVQLRSALLATPEGQAAFGATLVQTGDDAAELASVRGLLSLADRWTYARSLHPSTKPLFEQWATLRLPKPIVPETLVPVDHPDAKLPEVLQGHEHHLRFRDGFVLTDKRMTPREVMAEVDYCIFCHEREKDSCSKGMKAKDPVAEGSTYKKNALGIPLAGCPLDEKISETHVLKARGDSVGGLAMVMVDNPMCPGTGHRICNDCMKACIYQKQEPVNIPQIETSVLTDVLALPWGFEIYGLLTRWNPLNARRPFALPYLGKNVMVVGMGPAGYTLSHYLLNEGFGVVGIDGLKIEPLPDSLTGKNGSELTPIRDFREVTAELDQRILSGFGGVSEYGITVRWDKNFLTLIYLTLARREQFRVHGGIRFGGTLTIEDAWELGFDHIAIAAGAGKPTIIPMKNNLIRGIRKASDFLMALQLTGAFKRDSLANLQVQLPALVIGGGLTAVDTATELTAYYPVQVEKILSRHETLVARLGEAAILDRMDVEERATLETFLAHGRAIRAERARSAATGEPANFVKLIRQWGGVSILYRRGLDESPAYRLNHEEVTKALEEGVRFVERMSPVEAVPDEKGAVKELRFERMVSRDGKLRGSGEIFTFPARTVCVAAGTSPNVTYEREYPGTFEMDEDDAYFKGYELTTRGPVGSGAGFEMAKVVPTDDLGISQRGFFTSYRDGERRISFYGDNHPAYAGNVVKAMASAKDGYPEVARLFEADFAALGPTPGNDATAQSLRDQKLGEFFGRVDEAFTAKVVTINRLTHNIVEVVVRAPFAARRFRPGQFYRLQNFESTAPIAHETRLSLEGLALTGAWVDAEKGLLSMIVLEMGSSSRLVATLKPGEAVVLMGPTGAPTEIGEKETVLLAGGGLGNAVLFSIGRSLRAAGCKVVYFAAYRQKSDLFMREQIEASADQVVWSVDLGDTIQPERAQDTTFRGNVVQAMLAYAQGQLSAPATIPLTEVDRVIAIGSDRMMRAVKEARHGLLKPFLKANHQAIGSINSPMQCMMKEICAQCLQKHVDPVTGKETVVFSCYNQDQRLDVVDFTNLNDRLKANSVTEKLSNLWLDYLFMQVPGLRQV